MGWDLWCTMAIGDGIRPLRASSSIIAFVTNAQYVQWERHDTQKNSGRAVFLISTLNTRKCNLPIYMIKTTIYFSIFSIAPIVITKITEFNFTKTHTEQCDVFCFSRITFYLGEMVAFPRSKHIKSDIIVIKIKTHCERNTVSIYTALYILFRIIVVSIVYYHKWNYFCFLCEIQRWLSAKYMTNKSKNTL